MKNFKMLVIVFAFFMMNGCAASTMRGNLTQQFDTPTVHKERVETVTGSGRVDVTDITQCADDYCGGARGMATYTGGSVPVMSRQDFTLATAPHNPEAMVCPPAIKDTYDDGTVEVRQGQCVPASTPVVVETPIPSPQKSSPTKPAPRARSRRQ